jgi:hypothetical protein
MRADTLRGEVGGGGVALETSSFVGPCEIARADRRVQFGAQFGVYIVSVCLFFGTFSSLSWLVNKCNFWYVIR